MDVSVNAVGLAILGFWLSEQFYDWRKGLCQSGMALRSKGKANRNEKIWKAEENYATPFMNVTVDKVESSRISKGQT